MRYTMGGQKDRPPRISCKAPCLGSRSALRTASTHAIGVMELYERVEGIERLHYGLHSDYIVSRESPFGHLCDTLTKQAVESKDFRAEAVSRVRLR